MFEFTPSEPGGKSCNLAVVDILRFTIKGLSDFRNQTSFLLSVSTDKVNANVKKLFDPKHTINCLYGTIFAMSLTSRMAIPKL
jgi:hypothetical protein